MRRMLVMSVVLLLCAPVCWGSDQNAKGNQEYRDSYSLGFEFGNNIRRQGAKVNTDTILLAVREGLEGKKPALSPGEIRDTLVQLRKTLAALQDRRSREFADKNLAEAKTFLSGNSGKEGVKTLPSGLQYKVLKEGTGVVPKPTDSVTVNYRGTLINGDEFDSSYGPEGPRTVPLIGVIRGWHEALQLMKTGSRWQLFVPPELAYGKRQFKQIPPNSVLIFDLELLSIIKPSAVEPAKGETGNETGVKNGGPGAKAVSD